MTLPSSPTPSSGKPSSSRDSSDPARAHDPPERVFETVLRECGLHAALGFLNARTRHRFTGLYRLEPPTLRSVCLYDRENPGIKVGSDSPVEETYCSIVAAQGTPFGLDDSACDARVTTHPARDRVMSYCGVAVTDVDGSPCGTLCHFDLRPRITPLAEIPLMERAASLLLSSVRNESQSA